MTADPDTPPSNRGWNRHVQRRALRAVYANAALWAMGNGLIGSTLIVYLANNLHSTKLGLGIGVLLAAPRLAGLLRLVAPALLDRIADRKQFCLRCYFISAWLLLGIPLLVWPWRDQTVALPLLAGLWCCYHLYEYLATVALWSWLADLIPQRVRGRFLGWRERWMLTGGMLTMFAGAGFNYLWQSVWKYERGLGLVLTSIAGILFLLAAVWPLLSLPHVTRQAIARTVVPLSALLLPLSDGRFRRYLAFSTWFSFANGITQSARFMLVGRSGLDLPYSSIQALEATMRLGQITVAPALGACADRYGNRPVLLICQWIVTVSLLFLIVATPSAPYWICGAWLCWIAYAGHNVCMPNLLFKLAPSANRAAYVSVYQASADVAYALSTLAGGAAVDWLVLRYQTATLNVPLMPLAVMFVLGMVARGGAMLLLTHVQEPAAIALHRARR